MAQSALNLLEVDFFSGIPRPEAEELARHSEHRKYGDSNRVYSQGDRLPGVLVVVKGALKVFRTDGRGHIQVLEFLRAGQCVGEVSVFDGAPIASSAEAHGETELWLIPAAPLRDMAHRRPDVAEGLMRQFAAKVRHLVALVEALSLHSVPERVAQTILEYQAHHADRMVVEFDETQEELAQCVGASREAFSRALRLLSDLGLIHSTFPVVKVVDLAKLKRYAKG